MFGAQPWPQRHFCDILSTDNVSGVFLECMRRMSPETASANIIKIQIDRGKFVYRVGVKIAVFRWPFAGGLSRSLTTQFLSSRSLR